MINSFGFISSLSRRARFIAIGFLLSLGVVLPTAVLATSPITLYLTNGWQLARVPDVSQTGVQISETNFTASSSWITAIVPGTALTSYQVDGVIPDPYFGTNMAVDEELDSSPSIDGSGYYDTNYWYRDAFFVPRTFAGQRIWLDFDGINWKANIYVNGAYAGSINGPFIRSKFDITSLVAIGATNCVAVFLDWCDATVDDSPTFIGADSWDFMPEIAGRDVGLYQNVYLTTSGPVRIIDPFVVTSLALPATSPASLTLQVQLTNSSYTAVSGVLSGVISPDGISFQTNLIVQPGSAITYKFSPDSVPQLSVSNPALWWPNGYGPQNLHNLQLSFQTGGSTSDVQSVSFGIRQYSYDTNGHDLQLSCNGQTILCKGGNWGIADAMLKYTPGQLDTAVFLHRQMNFNMIRCWHGNCDLEAFYDACDKYGIMVWDEFWLNGSQDGLAPTDTGMFETSAVDKIKRLRNRACLAVWCGENEAPPPAELNTFLATNISQLDGTRIYFPASNAGGIHGGGPYAVQDPSWYFENANGFTTEIGLPSVPVVESMEAMMPTASLWPVGDTNWLLHNWAADIGNKGLSQYTNYVSADYGAATGIADFCYKAQLLNLQSYQAIFEAWNAQMFSSGATNPCSGALLWMSQPAWPSLIWQTYDWYFDLGGSFFGCKKACEPVHLQWDCNDGSIRVINATGHAVNNLTAQIQVFNLDSSLKYSDTVTNINVSTNSQVTCSQLFNGTNLALLQPVTVSSTDNSSDAGTNAVDGNLTTRWSSAYSDPQWFYVDLGSTQSFDSVTVLWESAYAQAFQIQVSNDASSWTTVWSTNNMVLSSMGGYSNSSFLPVNARYVRMYGTKRASVWGYSLYEFQVYKTGSANSGITGLSSVHFIKLKLTDTNDDLISDNFYWRGLTPLNYTALDSLPSVRPTGYAVSETDGTNTVITALLTNGTTNIAFDNRLMLVHSATGQRVLPVFFSDNYFTLLPGDSKTVILQFANTNFTASGDAPQLMIEGWNGYTSLNQIPVGPSVNLALDRPVSVSSIDNSSDGGSNAVDGNFSTRWSSAYSDPQWISIDLGSMQLINHVSLYWEAAYGKAYQIQVSTDDTNWTVVYAETNGTGGTENLSFNAVSARYLRMYGTSRGTIWGYSLWEFQVYGLPDLALNKDVVVSSVDNTNDPGPCAVDGNTLTRWSSDYSDPQWIEVDLGLVQSVNQVTLDWQTAYGNAYQIQVSTDDANWSAVYSESNGFGGFETDNFTSTPARYVRMYGISRGTIWGYSLWEFAIYNTNALDLNISGSSNPTDITNLMASYIANSGSSSIHLSWNAVSNATYLIESSTNLTDWTDYEQIVATNDNNSVDLPINNQSQMFFQIKNVP